MPELPEVETIRRDLDRELSGRQVERVSVQGDRSVRRHFDRAEFSSALVGGTVLSVARRGKYLLFPVDRGVVLVAHLGISGQLLLASTGDTVARHTHVVLGFAGERELRFVDPRTFGEVFVTRDGEVRELAHLGVDPLNDLKGWVHLGELLHARRAKLKALLMDQRFLAGIGNLYADEILFAARLRYDRSSETLSATEVRRLYRAMTTTLESAIQYRGSSLVDEQYRDVFGAIGGFQSRHNVYGREGQACRRCRQPIVRIKSAGRSTFLCARCQP